MATKARTVVRDIDLPLHQVRDIVCSEDFLLKVDSDSASTLHITDASREMHEDGSVSSSVTATTGEGSVAFEMTQTTEVSVPEEDGSFTVFTSVPLPKGIGTMATNQIYRAGDGGTHLESTVAVEVRVPLVGGKIAGKILDGAESSTDQGVSRIRQLAG